MVLILSENSLKIILKDLEKWNTKMAKYLEGIGIIMKWIVKDNLNGPMVNYILEIIKMIKNMEKECYF